MLTIRIEMYSINVWSKPFVILTRKHSYRRGRKRETSASTKIIILDHSTLIHEAEALILSPTIGSQNS